MLNTSHRRRSIRLPDYDYGQPGAYFITIVSHRRVLLFVEEPNCSIIQEAWLSIPYRFPTVSLDEFVIMPNHLHGIIVIAANVVGAIHELLLPEPTPKRRSMLLPKLIGYFKMNSAKHINILRSSPGSPVWQRGYYEHVIRTEAELGRVREYIRDNPVRWGLDRENPANIARPRPFLEFIERTGGALDKLEQRHPRLWNYLFSCEGEVTSPLQDAINAMAVA